MEVDSASSSSRTTKEDKESLLQPRPRRRCRNVCLTLTALAVAVAVVVVILAFTVFKPKRPVTTVDSVALDDLAASLDVARMTVYLNVSLATHLSLKNPNSVGFKYSSTSALFNYRDQLVGEAPVPAGKISPHQTLPLNLTVTLLADRLLSSPELFSDVMADALPLNTLIKISGKVSILSIFKLHVDSTASCDVTVIVSNRTVGQQQCKYKTKL